MLAAYPTVDWVKLAVFAVIGYLAAGGCGVLNSVYDQDIDKRMVRTSRKSNSIWASECSQSNMAWRGYDYCKFCVGDCVL